MAEGFLLVISGPSGVGKGTICKELLRRNGDILLSVSATTRKKRNYEEEGIHYYFKTTDEFKEMIKNHELIEWAEFCNNFYGTPKAPVDEMLSKGKNVILEIDVQGGLQIKNIYQNSIFIFTLPPSLEELKKRIKERGTEKKADMCQRIENSKQEIKFLHNYDYVVINDTVIDAVKKIEAIIAAEKCRVKLYKEEIFYDRPLNK